MDADLDSFCTAVHVNVGRRAGGRHLHPGQHGEAKLNPEDRAVVSPGRPRTKVTAAAKRAATGEV